MISVVYYTASRSNKILQGRPLQDFLWVVICNHRISIRSRFRSTIESYWNNFDSNCTHAHTILKLLTYLYQLSNRTNFMVRKGILF